tara:strand:- start:2476 stop:5415 length:2940 start_codon:yes stop_codon:yes gene_type:complete
MAEYSTPEEEERRRRREQMKEEAGSVFGQANPDGPAEADLKQSSGYGRPYGDTSGWVKEAAGSSPRDPLIASRAPVSTFTAPGSIKSGLEASPGLVRQSSGAPGSAGFIGGDPSRWRASDPEVPSTYEQMQGSPTTYPDTPRTHQQDYIDQFIADARSRQGIAIDSAAAGIAGGEVSDTIKHQQERARQSALSAAAGARGIPASAVHRMKTQQLSEADRAATEAAATQQMQAMQMVDDAKKADAQINAQLEGQRDNMIQTLIGQGVQRDVAIMQVDAQLEQQRRDLAYKYWAGKLGASTEVVKSSIEATGFFSDEVSTVAEMAPIINVLMGFGVPGGDTYGVPTQTVVGSREGEIGLATRSGGEAPPKGYVKNEATGRWELQEGYSKPDPVIVTRTNAQGNLVEMMKVWDEDRGTWEYVFEIDADTEAWLAARDHRDRTSNSAGLANARIGMQNKFREADGLPEMTEEEELAFVEDNIRTFGVASENKRRVADGQFEMTESEAEAYVQEVLAAYAERFGGTTSDEVAKQNIEPTGIGGYTSDDPGPSFEGDRKDRLLGGLSPDLSQKSKGLLPSSPAGEEAGVLPYDWRDTATTGLKATKEVLGGIGAALPLLGAKGKKQKEAALQRFGTYGLGKALEGGAYLLDDGPEDLSRRVADHTKSLIEASAEGNEALLNAAEGVGKEAAKEVLGEGGSIVSDIAAAAGDGATDVAADAAGAAADAGGASIPVVGPSMKLASGLLGGKDPGETAARATGSLIGGAAGSALGPLGTAAGSFLGDLGGKALSGMFGGTNLSNYDPDAAPNLDIGSSLTPPGDLAYSGYSPARFVNSGFETKTSVEGLHVPDALSYSSPQPTLGNLGQQLRWDSPGTISDEEAKSGVGPSQDELSNFLRELNPVKYDYKPEFGGETDQYGIIAQDAEKTAPGKSFVSKDENGVRRIDSGKATMVGLAADANQQRLIDSQSMMIAGLLKRLDRIEGKA